MKNVKSVLKIVQKIRASDQLQLMLGNDDIKGIAWTIKQEGEEINEDDVKEAADVLWIIVESEKAAGTTQTMASGGVQSGTQLIQSSTSDKLDLGLKIQQGLVDVLEQIHKGYVQVMRMYIIAFYLGVTMVLASVVASLVWREDASPLILGGMGMAGIIASLIFRPAQDLQNSRGNLAQLQAAFINWVTDSYNWDNYLYLMRKEASINKGRPSFDEMRKVSDILVQNTERMMSLISRYCEVGTKHRLEPKQEQHKEEARQLAQGETQATLEYGKGAS